MHINTFTLPRRRHERQIRIVRTAGALQYKYRQANILNIAGIIEENQQINAIEIEI